MAKRHEEKWETAERKRWENSQQVSSDCEIFDRIAEKKKAKEAANVRYADLRCNHGLSDDDAKSQVIDETGVEPSEYDSDMGDLDELRQMWL